MVLSFFSKRVTIIQIAFESNLNRSFLNPYNRIQDTLLLRFIVQNKKKYVEELHQLRRYEVYF